jgi:hypothetical protein
VPSFELERGRVVLLMRRLGLTPNEYQNPQVHGRDETGADVVAVFDDRSVGIQVTDLDTGGSPGAARALEARIARQAEGGVYATWAQNQADRLIGAISGSISRKSRMSFVGFDEFWLLACGGVPQSGAAASTFVMTPWLDTASLNAATAQILSTSRYTRAFIHVILGLEEQALYEWQRGVGAWSKSTLVLPSRDQGPSFWDCRGDSDLFNDPDGWCDREVQRFFAERRST